MNEIIKLYNICDDYIGECGIPKFTQPVTVITLESRYFVYDIQTKRYREGLNYFVSELVH